ncbi:3-oxoacyl-ACP reductase FabG [Buchnera aphidicola]|uniref:3-oxoacyl-ACP reductase FabG n=1 Tax=Buchnera aphidicola TaxID=9 RepID=UPI0031B8858B
MKKNKKIALIIGASKGIGLEIAKKLSLNNIFVIGTSTNIKGKKIIQEKIQNLGLGMILNLKNLKDIKICIQKIHKKFKKIDILINNAAIKHDKLIINMDYHDWSKVLKINLNSIFYISKLIVKIMLQNRYGRIITIGSTIGSTGNIGQSNYAASKSGLIGLNKSLALEVARKGITVNIISPGFIKTGMTKLLTDRQKKKYKSTIPMKRFGNPEEIASIALFLSSTEASYITGQTIHVNGGVYMN